MKLYLITVVISAQCVQLLGHTCGVIQMAACILMQLQSIPGSWSWSHAGKMYIFCDHTGLGVFSWRESVQLGGLAPLPGQCCQLSAVWEALGGQPEGLDARILKRADWGAVCWRSGLILLEKYVTWKLEGCNHLSLSLLWVQPVLRHLRDLWAAATPFMLESQLWVC